MFTLIVLASRYNSHPGTSSYSRTIGVFTFRTSFAFDNYRHLRVPSENLWGTKVASGEEINCSSWAWYSALWFGGGGGSRTHNPSFLSSPPRYILILTVTIIMPGRIFDNLPCIHDNLLEYHVNFICWTLGIPSHILGNIIPFVGNQLESQKGGRPWNINFLLEG